MAKRIPTCTTSISPVSLHGEQKAVREVVVAATDRRRLLRSGFVLLALLLFGHQAIAATLPVDNVDVLYHRYDGGGMVIDGPSVLVRKGIGSQVSVSGQYYVDSVSAASVDVLATASPYEEERNEYTFGVDYLNDKSILSLGFTNSTENDYEANTVYFSLSQEFFWGMSTVTMGYANGWDEVGRVGNDSFSEEADRRNYQLGLSQVVTRNRTRIVRTATSTPTIPQRSCINRNGIRKPEPVPPWPCERFTICLIGPRFGVNTAIFPIPGGSMPIPSNWGTYTD